MNPMARLLSALLALLLLAHPVTASAAAAPLVIFGDSVAADPPLRDYLAGKLSSSGQPECPTSAHNYGTLAAERLGVPVADFSCSGTTSTGVRSVFGGQDFSRQVDRALAAEALNPATPRVIVTTGFNDTYPHGDAAAEELFLTAMIPQVQRIQQAAPRARVQIVGYPTIADGEHICVVNTDRVVRVHAPEVGRWERQAQRMQADLAAAAGVEFLDLKESTANRHMCAPDELRHWSAIIDDGPANLPFHLNAHGHRHVAEVIARS